MSSNGLRKRAHRIDEHCTSKRQRVQLDTDHHNTPTSELYSSVARRRDVYEIPSSPEPVETASQQTFSRLRPLANFSPERNELQKQLERVRQELAASQEQLSQVQGEANRANKQIALLHRQLGQSQSQLMVAREDLLHYGLPLPQSPHCARQPTQAGDTLPSPQRVLDHRDEDRNDLQQLTKAGPPKPPARSRKQSVAPNPKPRGRPRKQSQTPAPSSRPRGRPRKSLVTEAKPSPLIKTSSVLTKRPTRSSTAMLAQSGSKSEQRLKESLARVLPRSVGEHHNASLKDDSALGNCDLDADDQDEGNSGDHCQGEKTNDVQLGLGVAGTERGNTVNGRTEFPIFENSVLEITAETSSKVHEMNDTVDEESEEDDAKPVLREDDSLYAPQDRDQDTEEPTILANIPSATAARPNDDRDSREELLDDGSPDTDTNEAKPIVLPEPSPDLVGQSETSSIPSSPPWFNAPPSGRPETSQTLTVPLKEDSPSTRNNSRRPIQRTAVPVPVSSQPLSRVASARTTREPSASFAEFEPLREQVAKITKKPKIKSKSKPKPKPKPKPSSSKINVESSSKPKPGTHHVAKEKLAITTAQTKPFDPRTTDFMKWAKAKGKGKGKAESTAPSDDEESDQGSKGSSASSSSDSESESERESESNVD